MVQKRPSAGDQSNEVSSKQARHNEPCSRLVSALEFTHEATAQAFHTSGKDDKNSAECKDEFSVKVDGLFDELQFCSTKDVNEVSPDSIFCSSWASGSSSEEDTNFEVPFHIPLPTNSYYYELPPRTNYHNVAATRSFYLDDPPRKLVPIGPQFQAEVPEWYPREISNTKTELAGTVVIAMPDSEDCEGIGVGRTYCACKDVRSISCVRQHILEAREKLEKNIGMNAFLGLGFGEMGVVVAELWSEEEEKLFQQVVFSNPVSLKKNFWDHLAIAFPSRTRKEIVSYYFNVYMLRTRTEQNRFDPMNADSDNDEWEAIDDLSDGEDEIGGDKDAPFVSPVETGSLVETDGTENFNENTYSYDYEYLEHDAVNFSTKSADMSKEREDKINSKCGSDYGDIDLKVYMGESESFDQRTDHSSNHEFEWDQYMTRIHPTKEIEFLPTCNMIEEVFGAGSWNYKAGDGL